MKQFYLKSFFLSLLMIVVGNVNLSAEEVTIASFDATTHNTNPTGDGWTVSNATYATASSGNYYKLISSNASIVTPEINWSEYSDITITISARKFGGPNATQGKISVSQGETELTSYSPSSTSPVASSALAISPTDGAITISCPGASNSKGCGVQSIVIKGTKNASTKTYTLVTNNDDEYDFEGLTLTTDELPADAYFHIKDDSGNNYYGISTDENLSYAVAINAENHDNLSTRVSTSNDIDDICRFFLAKESTWVFNITENADGTIKLSVTPEASTGVTKYMLNFDTPFEETDDLFVNGKLTKEMTTGSSFYIVRSDDYGIVPLEPSQTNAKDESNNDIWKFSDTDNQVGFGIGYPYALENRAGRYQVSEADTYNFTLDLENNTVTVKPSKTYTLVAKEEGSDWAEYEFDGLTRNEEFPPGTEFYIKDDKGNIYYGESGNSVIYAENHENLNTYYPVEDDTPADNPETFQLKKNAVWHFTITEPTEAGETIKLTVIPSTIEEVETTYMLSSAYLVGSDEVFDEDGKLTKQMDAGEAFYITRDDGFGRFNITAADHNCEEGGVVSYIWEFSEDAPTVGYIPAKIINVFRVKEAGKYIISLNTNEKTVTIGNAPDAVGNLNNDPETGVFAGAAGFTSGTTKVTGKITTDKGDVTVYYETFSNNGYLTNEQIRMYASGTILRFTAPDGYSMAKIKLIKATSDGGNLSNLSTEPAETYSNGTWEGDAESVTFTSSGSVRLVAAEVTLKDGGNFTLTLTAPVNGTVTMKDATTEATIASGTKLAPETVVALSATPKVGYLFDKWEVTPSDYAVNEPTSATTTFTMPSSAVTLNAVFKQDDTDYDIIIPVLENGSVTSNPAPTATYNTEVTLEATPDNDYVLTEWSVIDGNQNTIEVTVIDDTHAKFDMPQSSVTVSATFAKEVTITWIVNGTTYTTTVPEGTAIPFAAPTSLPEGCTFTGWVTSEIADVTETEPEYVTSATAAEGLTYYAVMYEGEAEETLEQELSYDTGTYYGSTTDKDKYRLFGNGAYVESAEFDLSKLSKVIVYGGRFGTISGDATGEISDGTNLWNQFVLTGTNNAKAHTVTGGAALSGTGKLQIKSTCGNGSSNGLRMSKIEIFTSAAPEGALFFTSVPEKVELTITEAGWATYVAAENVTFPADVNAFVIESVDAEYAHGNKVTKVKKGTPVIVGGDAGVHKLYKVDSANEVTNLLQVSDGTVTGDGTIWVLAVQNGDPGFARLSNGKTLSAGKAYLQVEAAGAKLQLVLDGEESGETNAIEGIETVEESSNNNDAWYNLQGVKVLNPQKGIYIHNGKKVVIK